MLFSDIEGSTQLLHRLGSRWSDALVQHRSVLRAAFTEYGGHEMGTEGDSFFVVFPTAAQALHAAVTGQRQLREQTWPDGVSLRVRMGLHTGEPQQIDDGGDTDTRGHLQLAQRPVSEGAAVRLDP